MWLALDHLGLLVCSMWCVLEEWKTMFYEEVIRKHIRGSEVGKKCPVTQLTWIIHLLMSAEDLCALFILSEEGYQRLTEVHTDGF